MFWYRLREIWREPWADTKHLIRCERGRHDEDKPGVMTGGITCRHCLKYLRFAEDRERALWQGKRLVNLSDKEIISAFVFAGVRYADLTFPGRHTGNDWEKDVAKTKKFEAAALDELRHRGIEVGG